MATTWLHVLHNAHVGLLCGGRLGVTKGSLTSFFLDKRKRMDLLVTSFCVVELSMDFVSESSSRERRTMAVRKLVSAKRSRGM